jgi:hypothetical protein
LVNPRAFAGTFGLGNHMSLLIENTTKLADKTGANRETNACVYYLRTLTSL